MALTDENGGMNTTMLVGPAGGMGYPYPVYQSGGNNGGGFDQGNGWWIILLFILLASGNWGNNGQNGGSMFGGAPIVVNDGNNGVQRGFDQAAVMGGINSIQAAVCGGFADVQNSLCNGFAQAEIANNGRQMANMQQAFANQMAMSQGFNALQGQLAQCCCDNRLATSQLQAVVQQENCADRAALSEGVRDIIVNQTANTQRILDQLCNDKIDAKNEKIADLERQLTMANLQASQIAQNTQIQNSIINELRSCPIPSQPVYGSQPIFTCPNNNGCGCGCS